MRKNLGKRSKDIIESKQENVLRAGERERGRERERERERERDRTTAESRHGYISAIQWHRLDFRLEGLET